MHGMEEQSIHDCFASNTMKRLEATPALSRSCGVDAIVQCLLQNIFF